MFGCLSTNGTTTARLENVIGVPFRTQICPPHVWLRGLSLWMTWPRPIFDTISLFVTYVYTNLILLLWTLGHMKQFRQQFSKIFQIPGTQWSSIMQFNQFCLSVQNPGKMFSEHVLGTYRVSITSTCELFYRFVQKPASISRAAQYDVLSKHKPTCEVILMCNSPCW